MSVRMRHTKGHTRNRRAHHSLKEPRLSVCDNCGEAHIRHRACPTCGMYRGRKVIDMEAQIAKKQEKMKRKEKELQAMGIDKGDKDNPLKEKKVAQKGPDESEKQRTKDKRGPLDLFRLSKRPEK